MPIRLTRKLFLALMLMPMSMSSGLVLAQDNPVVIQLPGTEVTRDDFNSRFEIAVRILAARQGIQYGTQSQEQTDMLRKQYLRQRGSELVMLQEAERLGVNVTEKDVAAAMADFYHTVGDGKSHEDTLKLVGFQSEDELKAWMQDQERIRIATDKLRDQIIVPPGDVMTMHHDMADQITVPEKICMRQISVADEATANKMLADLNAGSDFAALAKDKSIDAKTAANGGDMGCFEREPGHAARNEFESAAYNAPTGQVTGPVKSDIGYHLILVYDRVEAHSPSLNEAYAELENEIRHEKLPDVLAKIIDNSGLQTFPDRLESGQSGTE